MDKCAVDGSLMVMERSESFLLEVWSFAKLVEALCFTICAQNPCCKRLSGPAASTPKIDTRAAIVLGLTWWIAELQGHSLVSCGGGCGRSRVDVKLSSLRHTHPSTGFREGVRTQMKD
jgi:hypothetical protein